MCACGSVCCKWMFLCKKETQKDISWVVDYFTTDVPTKIQQLHTYTVSTFIWAYMSDRDVYNGYSDVSKQQIRWYIMDWISTSLSFLLVWRHLGNYYNYYYCPKQSLLLNVSLNNELQGYVSYPKTRIACSFLSVMLCEIKSLNSNVQFFFNLFATF